MIFLMDVIKRAKLYMYAFLAVVFLAMAAWIKIERVRVSTLKAKMAEQAQIFEEELKLRHDALAACREAIEAQNHRIELLRKDGEALADRLRKAEQANDAQRIESERRIAAILNSNVPQDEKGAMEWLKQQLLQRR